LDCLAESFSPKGPYFIRGLHHRLAPVVTNGEGEINPGHRDRRSGDRDKLITITSELVITFHRNPDHDQPGIPITIARNR
jgi:hypothetical protein